jgi:hypothetical protein
MDPVTSPFRTGAGRKPPVLAGGEPILDGFTVMRRKVDEFGEGDRGWVLIGLRGVGKTVLLNELLAQVSDKGWIAAKVEVPPTISHPVALSAGLVRSVAGGDRPAPRTTTSATAFHSGRSASGSSPSGMVSLGVEVDPVVGAADTDGSLRTWPRWLLDAGR